jgi:homoserine O-succinyltransferase
LLLDRESVRRRNNAVLMSPMRRAPHTALVVGLVNNMPSAAARTTEWQFRLLLDAAAGSRPVHLRVFIPPALRAEGGDWALADQTEDLDAIWDAELDGLIVTGAEPRTAEITDEPFWPLLASLTDWAAERTLSTIWSCLAAHAAVMRLDDLARHPLPTKMSGVFPCVRAADHPLLRGLPPRWPTPHSRCNEIDAKSLAEQGYQILSRIPGAGADCFARQAGGSLFVMMQGHPEYDADCLLREYRRDVKRFLTGRRPLYPLPPAHYFGADIEAALADLRDEAMRRPAASLLTRLDAIVDVGGAPSWHQPASRLYAAWLDYLAAEKSARCAPVARAAIPHSHSLVHP